LASGLRVVTLLTTDVVSSTEQQLRLGDHRSDELRRERDGLVAQEIERARGTVIKSTGDGTYAAFAAPSEALACAVAVQRALARRNLAASERVELRIGLATGEVVVEDGDVFGRAAIESTRITAQARGGEILCCSLTRELAAPRSTCPIEPAGEVALKGFSAPVPIWRVGWAEALEPVVPLPDALGGRARRFVGRSSILALAADLWATTAAGQRPHLLVLGGEPGVGKTSVLARFATDVHRSGATVLYGRCTENDIDSLRPIREALAQYAAARGAAHPDELGSGRTDLVRLLPELGPPAAAPTGEMADARAGTAALFDAVARWLGAASRVRPVLLVIDDAEWLDGQTGGLLRRLCEEEGLGPILLALAHRDREPLATGVLADLVTRLRSTSSTVETVRLTGLSVAESAALVARVSPAAGDQGDLLHRDSGGNPLYLLELLRAQGRAADDAAELSGARDLAELVLRRVDRLPPACVAVLEAGAVLGQSFEVDAIDGMMDEPTDDTLKRLDELVRSELLHEVGTTGVRFEFSHAVVREAVYDRLTHVRRIACHRRAAETLEGLVAAGHPVPARDIARHHQQTASPARIGPALAAFRRAARDATDRLAYEEVGRWLESGLDLYDKLHLPPDDEYVALLLERAIASQQAGERGTRRRFFRAAEAARAAGDAARLIRVALAFDRGFFATLGRADEDRIALLREARSLASGSPPDRACLLALLASELTWQDPAEERFTLADEALEQARAAGDRATLVRVLSLRPPTIWAPATHRELRAAVDELGELTGEHGDPVLEARYLTFRFGVTAEAGDLTALPGVIERLGQVAWFLRLPVVLWHVAILRANLALATGRLADARALAEESLDWGQRARQPEALMFYAAIELEVRRLCGGLDEMIPQLELARAGVETGGYSATRYLYDAGLATAAREDYSQAVRATWAMPKAIQGGPTVANLAYLAARFEDIASADRLLRLLEPYAGRFFQAIATYHVTEHYLGMLAATTGRWDEAADRLRAAVEQEEGAGAVLLAAESRLEWARLALLEDEWAGPAPGDLIDPAIAAAEAAGAAAVAQRARDLRSRL
jgi:class 3 adenylate cyclase